MTTTTLNTAAPTVSRLALMLGFLAIYVIWGSTYLAIRFGIESMPPFLMASVRFLLPGIGMYAWTRWRGAPALTMAQWRSATIIGSLLLLGGNGIVTWAEQWVPSGLTALLIASVPLWVAVFQWIFEPESKPGPRGTVGLLIGFVGVAFLIRPEPGTDLTGPFFVGMVSLVLASAFWAGGSVYSRHADLPRDPIQATAAQMLMGSVGLFLAGSFSGEWGHVDLQGVTTRSLLALAYLIVFGSVVAFSAYVWLLRVTSAAKVATYAYVNPVVAVFLGWALAGETFDSSTLVAAAVILAAVMMITTERSRQMK